MKAFLASLVVFVLFSSQSPTFVEAASSQKFLRLNIEVSSSGVRLRHAKVHSEGMNVRKQKLETRRDPFLYRVISDDGEILFEDTFVDPRMQFYDEPDESGLLHGGVIQNNAAVTSITIPYSKKSMRVDFFQRLQGTQTSALNSSLLHQFGSIPITEVQTSMQATSASQAIRPVKIQKTGKPRNRIDMLFLAEGFTVDQRNLFLETVKEIVATWKKFLPWSDYFKLLNIYAVPLVSQDEGADHPSNEIFKDTALDATYDCFNISYLLCIDYDKALTAASESLPTFDYVIALVNDPEYGGSGGVVPVFSLHSEAKEIFFHEIAHTFASLGDEYVVDMVPLPPFDEKLYPNITKQTNRNRVKWKQWIRPETPVPTPEEYQDVIGIFKGALFDPTAYYRPKSNCLMRTLGVPLDSVCAEAHFLKALDLVSLVDDATPSSKNVILSMNGAQTFTMKPAPVPFRRLQFQWFLDENLIDHAASILTLSGSQLTPGAHQVTVQVTDTTSMIRTDREKLRTDSYTWTVTVR